MKGNLSLKQNLKYSNIRGKPRVGHKNVSGIMWSYCMWTWQPPELWVCFLLVCHLVHSFGYDSISKPRQPPSDRPQQHRWQVNFHSSTRNSPMASCLRALVVAQDVICYPLQFLVCFLSLQNGHHFSLIIIYFPHPAPVSPALKSTFPSSLFMGCTSVVFFSITPLSPCGCPLEIIPTEFPTVLTNHLASRFLLLLSSVLFLTRLS